MTKITYNTDIFPFKPKIENLFQTEELSGINENIEIFSREKDQSTKYHKMYYEWARTDKFIQLYDKFILEDLQNIFQNRTIVVGFCNLTLQCCSVYKIYGFSFNYFFSRSTNINSRFINIFYNA